MVQVTVGRWGNNLAVRCRAKSLTRSSCEKVTGRKLRLGTGK